MKNEWIARQRAIVDGARAAHRELTADEQREFDELQRKIDNWTDNSEPEPDVNAQRDAAIQAERDRISSITDLCREFDIDAKSFIDGGNTVEDVRKAVIDKMRSSHAPIDVHVQRDEADKFREAAADALVIRSGIGVDKPADGAMEMSRMSLRDMGIEALSRDGVSINQLHRMDSSEIFSELCRGMYNPAASFPAILDASVNKAIVEEYNKIPTTFQAWTTKGTLTDFKKTADREYVLGGNLEFLEVPENGELKNSTPEMKELPQRQLKTYGRQFSMTRQAFVDDDIGLVTRIPAMYAVAAKRTIDKQVYSTLYNNGIIHDGKTLFNDDHKNLIAGGTKPTQAAIQAAILQMQKQTDPFGEPIYMTPKYLVVPMGYEFDLAVIFGSAQVTSSGNNDINPLYNYPLTVVQSPVLNALAKTGACPWFLVSDPNSAKGIQVDYLNGVETPTVRRMEAPGVLGFTWDMYLDWGIAIRDYRGLVKNPGVTL